VLFTVDERERVRERLLALAGDDPRIVAAALVGAEATDRSDRWSDLDLTFGVAAGESVEAVMADWTETLAADIGAVHLFDLAVTSSRYRVFLAPGSLQIDLSFTPEAEFGALGPSFRLLFGTAVERPPPPPWHSARHMSGLAVHHAVRARFCIERGRRWQAEYWISGLRDQTLALACDKRGLEPAYGRGIDQLPAELLAEFEPALVRSLEREELLRALAAAIEVLLRESGEPATLVEPQLRELAVAAPAV
jgi:hypothetical protein